MKEPLRNAIAQDTKKRPEATLREGLLKATIWRNESERGPYFSTQYERSYKDDQGQWRDTAQMRESDHLPLRHLAGRTHDRVSALKQELSRTTKERANDSALAPAPNQSR